MPLSAGRTACGRCRVEPVHRSSGPGNPSAQIRNVWHSEGWQMRGFDPSAGVAVNEVAARRDVRQEPADLIGRVDVPFSSGISRDFPESPSASATGAWL